MKKYLAMLLRRAANRLDPAPAATWKLFEPMTVSTSGTTYNFKVVER